MLRAGTRRSRRGGECPALTEAQHSIRVEHAFKAHDGGNSKTEELVPTHSVVLPAADEENVPVSVTQLAVELRAGITVCDGGGGGGTYRTTLAGGGDQQTYRISLTRARGQPLGQGNLLGSYAAVPVTGADGVPSRLDFVAVACAVTNSHWTSYARGPGSKAQYVEYDDNAEPVLRTVAYVNNKLSRANGVHLHLRSLPLRAADESGGGGGDATATAEFVCNCVACRAGLNAADTRAKARPNSTAGSQPGSFGQSWTSHLCWNAPGGGWQW